MQKWEYGCFTLHNRFRFSRGNPTQQKQSEEVTFTELATGKTRDYQTLQEALNALGLDGWEMSGIFAGQIATQYFFKRPLGG
jgi:hypothetical protein